MNKERKRVLIQIALFIVTVITTTLAGVEWMYAKYLAPVNDDLFVTWPDFIKGLHFSLPFLFILTCHEFGHYFTARYYQIRVTLPYYIPLWLGFMLLPSLGTMGAMIRIKDRIYSLKHYFDVGVSGPLAGFVIAVGVIAYGYANLPEPEQIFEIHPEYEQFGLDYPKHVYSYDFAKAQDSLNYLEQRAEDSIAFLEENSEGEWSYPEYEAADVYPSMYFGKPLFFILVEDLFVSDTSRIPRKEEIMHNPYLLAGILALFFTALNLLPIGQLDGGHIIFGLFGPSGHKKISRVLFTIFLFYAGLGMIQVSDLKNTGMESSFYFLLVLIAYLYFLYICAYSMFSKKSDRWTYAAILMTTQFVVSFLFDVEGYSGWLLFAFLLGRVLGVDHPKVADNRPISLGRKIIGWVTLVVFILSFSPEPFVIEFL